MRYDTQSGWYPDLRRCPSPNHNVRPGGAGPAALADVDLIVIHGISLPPGIFCGPDVERLFTNTLPVDAHPYYRGLAGLHVSAHFLVRRTGAVTQFVSLHDRAWHAGASQFAGRTDCNDFSVGIEVEGADEDPYTPVQFERLVWLTRDVMSRIGLSDVHRVVGHVDIAPGRKTDPGPFFEWDRFRNRLISPDNSDQ